MLLKCETHKIFKQPNDNYTIVDFIVIIQSSFFFAFVL
jgi:hypothetical protein